MAGTDAGEPVSGASEGGDVADVPEVDVVRETDLEGPTLLRRGKVRDIYEAGPDHLVLVASDRVSAFDRVLEVAIPWKGRVLTRLSTRWMRGLEKRFPHHLVSTDPADFPEEFAPHADFLRGRAVLCRRVDVIPIECVVRGWMASSVLEEYRAEGTVRHVEVEPGLELGSRLPEPIFTPARKVDDGHDEDIPFSTLVDEVGADLARNLKRTTLELYRRAAERAAGRGLILADTKVEFGRLGDELVVCDELLTPDASRYWEAEGHESGRPPRSFDKQIVRDWLAEQEEAGGEMPSSLPSDVVRRTARRYLELFERLVGEPLPDLEEATS